MAQTVNSQLSCMDERLDRELSKHAVFLQAERRTGIRKTRLVYLTVAGLVGFFVLKWAADVVLALVAFVYPAVKTVTAIERGDKKEDAHWLVYWVVLAFWSTVESLTGELFPAIIPMYAVIKLAICIWLFSPQTRGATVVYERALRPVVLAVRDHPVTKDAVERVRKSTESFAADATKVAKETSAKAAKKVTADEAPKSIDDEKDD
jgi:hypothetical protein